jgi:hypothetical protein
VQCAGQPGRSRASDENVRLELLALYRRHPFILAKWVQQSCYGARGLRWWAMIFHLRSRSLDKLFTS